MNYNNHSSPFYLAQYYLILVKYTYALTEIFEKLKENQPTYQEILQCSISLTENTSCASFTVYLCPLSLWMMQFNVFS